MRRQRWTALLLFAGLTLGVGRVGWGQGFAPGAIPQGAQRSLNPLEPAGSEIETFFNPDAPGPQMAGPGMMPGGQMAPGSMPHPGAYCPPPGPYGNGGPGPMGPIPSNSPIMAGQGGGPGPGPNSNPWPKNSFFDFDFQQHINKDGLWFMEQKGWGRDYFGNAEVFFARVRQPSDAIVGSVPIALQTPFFDNGGARFPVVSTDAMFNFVQQTVTANDTNPGEEIRADPILVNERRAGHVPVDQTDEDCPDEYPYELGGKFRWGWIEPAGHGFDVSGYFISQSNWSFSRGFDPNPPFNGEGLAVTAALALNNGTPEGVLVPYDRFFGIQFESQSASVSSAFRMTPLYKNDWMNIKPLIGLRYLWIGEAFQFEGRDSGGSVTFDGSGPAQVDTYVQSGSPYETQIRSEITSHLFAPEAGVSFDIGGDRFKILGRTAVGLAANFEELELSGFGVGDGFTDPNFIQNRRFSENRDHVRLSPIASAEVILEMNIIPYIPLLKRVRILREAKIQGGYNVLAAYQLHRPHKSIEYNAQPLTPTIRENDRDRWYLSGYTLGIHWDF